MQIGTQPVNSQPVQPPKPQTPVMQPVEIKALLYLGIPGKIALPLEKTKVDIIV